MLEGIAELISDAMEGVYDTATLEKASITYAANGDATQTVTYHSTFAHPVARSSAYRVAAGIADDEIELIVLAPPLGEVEVKADDVLVLEDGRSFTVMSAKRDGPKSQWLCRGKERSDG